ncbi:hypothetical protein CVT26_002874 [Gymnopilus dilepis]|uniref:Uncharacterized protein n=1 Tax=Gymnopilus dilepis TaxID=231916 RepID=A0A409VT69_9AGAR|nr:hypothetical protein CVT26_002874 [Gymnopilus dilepis]
MRPCTGTSTGRIAYIIPSSLQPSKFTYSQKIKEDVWRSGDFHVNPSRGRVDPAKTAARGAARPVRRHRYALVNKVYGLCRTPEARASTHCVMRITSATSGGSIPSREPQERIKPSDQAPSRIPNEVTVPSPRRVGTETIDTLRLELGGRRLDKRLRRPEMARFRAPDGDGVPGEEV